MKRYTTIHKSVFANGTRKEYDWIVNAFRYHPELGVLRNHEAILVPVGWAVETMENTLDRDDLEAIDFIAFLRELHNKGVLYAILAVPSMSFSTPKWYIVDTYKDEGDA